MKPQTFALIDCNNFYAACEQLFRPELRGRPVVDRVNVEWGRGALRQAREGLAQTWRMRQGRRSPRYTTRWEELPVVGI